MGRRVISGARAATPFIAPFYTVAGGNVVGNRIRALEGFDEAGFEAARDGKVVARPGGRRVAASAGTSV